MPDWREMERTAWESLVTGGVIRDMVAGFGVVELRRGMRLLIDGCRLMEWMRWKMGRGDEDRMRDLSEELDEETLEVLKQSEELR
jgi:hypothetical protein